jgi:hypothetical protein
MNETKAFHESPFLMDSCIRYIELPHEIGPVCEPGSSEICPPINIPIERAQWTQLFVRRGGS